MNYSNTYQPYSYRVIHKTSKKFYYGIQYGKDAHPNNLWNTYFTSSITIKELIYVFGKDDFEFEIRQLFQNSNEAKKWEQKVLKKIDLWETCLNKPTICTNYYGGAIEQSYLTNAKGKIRITNGNDNILVEKDYKIESPWYRGTTISSEGKKKLGRKKGTKYITNGIDDKILNVNNEIPEGWYLDTSKNKHNLGKIYVNNGIKTIIVYPNEIPEGYEKGMIMKNSVKGKKCINKNGKIKIISINDMNEYLDEGWSLGRK